jgi:hypothetical protein
MARHGQSEYTQAHATWRQVFKTQHTLTEPVCVRVFVCLFVSRGVIGVFAVTVEKPALQRDDKDRIIGIKFDEDGNPLEVSYYSYVYV